MFTHHFPSAAGVVATELHGKIRKNIAFHCRDAEVAEKNIHRKGGKDAKRKNYKNR